MSRYIFFEKPHKSLVFSFGEGRDVSQLRRSTQTHQNAIRSARENWAYFRFCILSFLNLRPSHLFLIIFNTDLWDNKAVKRKKKWSQVTLQLSLRL